MNQLSLKRKIRSRYSRKFARKIGESSSSPKKKPLSCESGISSEDCFRGIPYTDLLEEESLAESEFDVWDECHVLCLPRTAFDSPVGMKVYMTLSMWAMEKFGDDPFDAVSDEKAWSAPMRLEGPDLSDPDIEFYMVAWVGPRHIYMTHTLRTLTLIPTEKRISGLCVCVSTPSVVVEWNSDQQKWVVIRLDVVSPLEESIPAAEAFCVVHLGSTFDDTAALVAHREWTERDPPWRLQLHPLPGKLDPTENDTGLWIMLGGLAVLAALALIICKW